MSDSTAEPEVKADQSFDPNTMVKVLNQIDFYFGDANFRRDKFLKAKAKENDEGFVDIKVLLTFNKLKQMLSSIDEAQHLAAVESAVQKSTVVALKEGGGALRRREKLEEDVPNGVLNRSIYAKGFPKDPPVTHEQVESNFNKFGKVMFVTLRKYKPRDSTEKLFKGSVFVEFESEEVAQKVVANAEAKKFEGKDLVDIRMMKDYLEMKKTEGKKRGSKKDVPKEDAAPEPVEFEKGLILIVRDLPSDANISRENLKAAFEKFGNVAYVDFSQGQGLTEAMLRFEKTEAPLAAIEEASTTPVKIETSATDSAKDGEDQESSSSASNVEVKDTSLEVMTGDAEQTYYEKIRDRRAATLERKKGKGKGGKGRGKGKGRGGGKGGRGGGGRKRDRDTPSESDRAAKKEKTEE